METMMMMMMVLQEEENEEESKEQELKMCRRGRKRQKGVQFDIQQVVPDHIAPNRNLERWKRIKVGKYGRIPILLLMCPCSLPLKARGRLIAASAGGNHVRRGIKSTVDFKNIAYSECLAGDKLSSWDYSINEL